MIVDNIKNADRYAGLAWLAESLDNAAKYSDPGLDIGAYPIRDGLRAVVNRYTPSPYEEGKFENHREYVDVQYIVSGSELILAAPAGECRLVREYDAAADYEMYAAKPETQARSLRVKAGDFVVLYPGEAHYPGVSDGSGGDVHKIIFKVRL